MRLVVEVQYNDRLGPTEVERAIRGLIPRSSQVLCREMRPAGPDRADYGSEISVPVSWHYRVEVAI